MYSISLNHPTLISPQNLIGYLWQTQILFLKLDVKMCCSSCVLPLNFSFTIIDKMPQNHLCYIYDDPDEDTQEKYNFIYFHQKNMLQVWDSDTFRGQSCAMSDTFQRQFNSDFVLFRAQLYFIFKLWLFFLTTYYVKFQVGSEDII